MATEDRQTSKKLTYFHDSFFNYQQNLTPFHRSKSDHNYILQIDQYDVWPNIRNGT